MSATASVRNKFYSKQEIIDESAGDYHEVLAEQKRRTDEENARQCIVDGINPRTGEALSLEEHQGALLRINASPDELEVYLERRRQQRDEQIAADLELSCWASSQYPCADCTLLLNTDEETLNPAQRMLVDMIS